MTSLGRRWRRRREAPESPDRPVRPFVAEAVATDFGLLVDVVGEVDIATSPALRETLTRRPDPGDLLLVDLTRVTFLDSSGLSVLLALRQDMLATGGRLAIVCPAGPARLLFEVTGVDTELPLFTTREEALATQ